MDFGLDYDAGLWGGDVPAPMDSGGGGDFFGLGIDAGNGGGGDFFNLGMDSGIWMQDFSGPASAGPVVASSSPTDWSPLMNTVSGGLNAAIGLWTQERAMDMRQDWMASQLEYFRSMNQIERDSNIAQGPAPVVVRAGLPSWAMWAAVGVGVYLIAKAV